MRFSNQSLAYIYMLSSPVIRLVIFFSDATPLYYTKVLGSQNQKEFHFIVFPLRTRRSENTPLTLHSRVCSVHFKGGKKSGKNDVPEIFQWTKTSPPK